MSHKGKVLVFLGSFLIAVYGLTAAFYGKVVAQDDAYRELRVFMEVLDRINDDYVEVPNMNAVQDGAMRGLIDALDPYSFPDAAAVMKSCRSARTAKPEREWFFRSGRMSSM